MWCLRRTSQEVPLNPSQTSYLKARVWSLSLHDLHLLSKHPISLVSTLCTLPSEASSTDFLVSLQTSPETVSPGKARLARCSRVGAATLVKLWLYLFAYLSLSLDSTVLDGR